MIDFSEVERLALASMKIGRFISIVVMSPSKSLPLGLHFC